MRQILLFAALAAVLALLLVSCGGTKDRPFVLVHQILSTMTSPLSL